MSIIDDLIFDRTTENLVPGDPKGKYDYVDYNRVGEATNYVAEEIEGLDIDAKTDWDNTTIPTDTLITDYRQNIQTIIDSLYLTNSIPSTNNGVLTILGANQIEKALFDAHNIVIRILRWNDVDSLDETWDQLDAKRLVWNEYFLKQTG